MATRKQNFTVTEDCDRMLVEIQQKYGLTKSDSVRRGIEMLYDHLVKDLQPEQSSAGKVQQENKETA